MPIDKAIGKWMQPKDFLADFFEKFAFSIFVYLAHLNCLFLSRDLNKLDQVSNRIISRDEKQTQDPICQTVSDY